MKHSIFRLTRALVALLALIAWNSANAAPITESLGVEIVFGPGAGETGTIDVTYDDLDISGTGDEFLDSSLFTLEMMLFGQTFTALNDVGYPVLPELGFFDGVIVYIDYVISESDLFNPTPIDDPRIEAILGFDVDAGVWLADTLGPLAVPIPATPALFLAGFMAWMTAGHRRLVSSK